MSTDREVPTPWAQRLERLAVDCLHQEVDTYPKPGLVSHHDCGAHTDMDAELLHRSADVLGPFFGALATAGAAGVQLEALRQIGMEAERVMLAATGGINTHRGAFFGLGLMVAAAAYCIRHRLDLALGPFIARRWGGDIRRAAGMPHSHGSLVVHQYGVGGAREEAASGFPTIYAHSLPALREGQRLACGDAQAARVQAFMVLLSVVDDTNLLYRGGREGLLFARCAAVDFLGAGGILQADWRLKAIQLHHQLVARRLSPGGCGDLLAMTLFVDALSSTNTDDP